MAYKIVEMKFLVVISLVFAFANIQRIEGKMDIEGLRKATAPLKGSCVKASGVDVDVASGVTRGEFPEDPKLMCYLKCIFQKLKAIKNGKFSIESMRAQTNALVDDSIANRMIALIEACVPLGEVEDLCRASFDYSICYYNLDSSLAFFPA